MGILKRGCYTGGQCVNYGSSSGNGRLLPCDHAPLHMFFFHIVTDILGHHFFSICVSAYLTAIAHQQIALRSAQCIHNACKSRASNWIMLRLTLQTRCIASFARFAPRAPLSCVPRSPQTLHLPSPPAVNPLQKSQKKNEKTVQKSFNRVIL